MDFYSTKLLFVIETMGYSGRRGKKNKGQGYQKST